PAPAPAPASTGKSKEELHREGEAAGIHNLAEVAPGILRGAQPEGDASFALLAGLGVRTILSVDGAAPDVEGAARHGIRTVHIPTEYSGVTRDQQVRIAKVAQVAAEDGGLFVHCHHGKHRGPAASGVAWMARDGVPGEAAVADMKAAGTDPNYRGLYRDVLGFRPVTAEELARVTDADLPPVARVPDLVGSMVDLDRTFERMKAVKAAGWRTPAGMPDVQPSHEARILAERFRELLRLEDAKVKAEDFRGWAAGSEKAAWELEAALEAGDGKAAAAALETVSVSCKDCHSKYRNN
ncbi:MAG: cytochrome c, partial [Planctomycetaceae bacterium]|nr:cytochrome c [Planctomycetaceae bacterium]